MKTHKLKNTRELADILGVDVSTVARWKRNGCPYEERKPYAMGVSASRPLYDLERVIAWLESRRGKEAQA